MRHHLHPFVSATIEYISYLLLIYKNFQLQCSYFTCVRQKQASELVYISHIAVISCVVSKV